MNITKQKDLQTVIATIQKKWGANVICQGSTQQTLEYLSTGFPKLDALIGRE